MVCERTASKPDALADGSDSNSTIVASCEEKRRRVLLSDQERHGLIGNSFSVFVVEQLLSPLRGLANASTPSDVDSAVNALRLRDRAGDRAYEKR